MFKLIRIEGSGVNVPEPHKFKKEVGIYIIAGEALNLNEGIVCGTDAEASPTLMSYAAASEEADEVLCFYVTPAMLFESKLAADTAVKAGDMMLIAEDDNASMSLVGGIEGGHIEIVNPLGATKRGDTVIIRFI